jgi:uncharacterized protein DUF3140
MAAGQVSDREWSAFHEAVNMTSAELRDWLGVEADGVGVVPRGRTISEAEPDVYADDMELGRQVLAILGKRRTDLTSHDADVMGRVVGRIGRLRSEAPEEPAAGTTHHRHRLMTLGHDPLKPENVSR